MHSIKRFSIPIVAEQRLNPALNNRPCFLSGKVQVASARLIFNLASQKKNFDSEFRNSIYYYRKVNNR